MAMVTETSLVWFLGKLVFFITNLYEKYIVKTLKITKQTNKKRAKFRKHQHRENKNLYPAFSGKVSLDTPTHFTLYDLYFIHPTLTIHVIYHLPC